MDRKNKRSAQTFMGIMIKLQVRKVFCLVMGALLLIPNIWNWVEFSGSSQLLRSLIFQTLVLLLPTMIFFNIGWRLHQKIVYLKNKKEEDGFLN